MAKKRKLTDAQRQAKAEYDKIRRQLREKLNRAKEYGIEGLPDMPKIPEHKNKKSIQKLKNQVKNLFKKATYKTPEGKILKGEEEIRRYQKQKAGQAGGEATARKRKEARAVTEETKYGVEVKIDPETGEIISGADEAELITELYETPIPEDIEEENTEFEDVFENEDYGKDEEEIADELREILSQVREYIDAIEYTEDDGASSDEEVADRKDILHSILDNAIDQYGEEGVGLILREAAENGDLNDLIDGAVRGSDEYSAFCFGELSRIINGGALSPSQAAKLADMVDEAVGYSRI